MDEELNIANTYYIYLPNEFLNYKYLFNVTNDYIELCDTEDIIENNTYNTVRVYNSREGFCVPYNATSLVNSSLPEVNVTNNFFARRDSMSICLISFLICYCIVLLFNIMTEFINKGGILH